MTIHQAPPAFTTPPPLCPLAPPPLLPPICRLVVATPLVAPPMTLVLSMLQRTLSTDASPPAPVCLLFASCCHVALVVMPPPPLVLSMHRLCLATRHCLLSTYPPGCLLFAIWLSCCISLHRLYLFSPFVAPPPHMSILHPPPSFTPAGCCLASCRAAFASCPLINSAASLRPAASHCPSNSTSRLLLICPDWLLHCLLWHLHLTFTSLPSPLPPPLVASCSCPPWLVVALSPINLRLFDRHPQSPLPPMVGSCVFQPLRHLSLLVHGLSSHCAVASHSSSIRPLVRLVLPSPPFCPAGCCIASPHTTAFHLRAPPPLIAPLPLVMPLSVPLPLMPLVRLVVASPLLMPLPPVCRHLRLSLRCPLLLRHGLLYLFSGWLLHCLSSRRCLPSSGISSSHCAIASCHAMASCASCSAGCRASATHPLGASMPLNAPPPPPTSSLPFICPGWLSNCF